MGVVLNRTEISRLWHEICSEIPVSTTIVQTTIVQTTIVQTTIVQTTIVQTTIVQTGISVVLILRLSIKSTIDIETQYQQRY